MPVRTSEGSNMSTEVDNSSVRVSGFSENNLSSLNAGAPALADTFNASIQNSTEDSHASVSTSHLKGRDDAAMEVDDSHNGGAAMQNGKGNGVSHSDEEETNEPSTAGEGRAAEEARTPKRPRRAAAAAANQKMQQRRTPTASKSAVKSASRRAEASPEAEVSKDADVSEPSSPASPAPKAKRQKRSTAKSDPTFNVSDVNTTLDSQEVTAEPTELIQSSMKNRRRPGADVVFNSSTPRRRIGGRPSASIQTGDDEQVRSLYQLLRNEEQNVDQLIDSWMDVYKERALTGYLELASFLVQSAGCRAKVTVQMANMNNVDVVRQLATKFEEDSSEYPLVKSGPDGRRFRTEFVDFLDKLIDTIKQGILLDDYLMPQLSNFLIELSDSSVRAFRHTATLAGVKIMTALVNASKVVKHSLKDAEKLLQAEESKKRPNKEALQMRKKTHEDHERTVEKIHNLFDKLCKAIFYQRYRDHNVQVRELCMEELGEWMKRDPQRYVDDTYLKYLGWSLNDKEASVRRKCLQSILLVYQQDDNKDRLKLFTNKFKDRFVQMATAEVDGECAVKAMKMCCAMDKLQDGVFLPDDLENLYQMIYVMDRPLALATADFLVGRMEQLAEAAGDNRGDERRNLVEVVNFVAESGEERHSAYLVDSLMEVMPAIKAWEAMTSLLLQDTTASAEGETALSDDLQQILIAIMCWAIKQVATGEGPVGRSTAAARKNKLKDKEKEKVETDKRQLTTHFITALPQLLSKYKQDVRKVGLLISVPQYFDVNMYTRLLKEDELDRLLDLLVEMFEGSEELALLRQCTKSLEALQQQGSGTVNRVAAQKSVLAEAVSSKFKEALPLWLAGGSEREVVYAVESSLMRLSALFSTFDLSFLELWEDLFSVCVKSLSQEDNSCTQTSLVRKVVNCCTMHLTWRLVALKKLDPGEGHDQTRPSDEEIATHMQRVHDFINCLIPQLANAEAPNETVSAMFVSVLDLLVLHHHPKAEAPAWQSSLNLQLNHEQQSVLANFIDSHVFSSTLPATLPEDARAFQVHKRRLLLLHFSRALTAGTIKPRYASAVFKHYLTNSRDYGDVVKDAVRRLQETSKSFCAEAVAATLVDLFVGNQAKLRRNSKELGDLKDAAKRYAVLFATDNDQGRKAMGLLHKYCIEFISSAANDADLARRVLFFDVLVEFAPRLKREDKASIVRHLGTLSNLPGHLNADERVPFMQYKNQLTLSGIDDTEQVDKHRRGRRVNAPTPKAPSSVKSVGPRSRATDTPAPSIAPSDMTDRDQDVAMEEAPSAPEVTIASQAETEAERPPEEERDAVDDTHAPEEDPSQALPSQQTDESQRTDATASSE
ncbi:hypothetical protein RvY_13482 [Ramazzottius varieornatus]|uniref:SCD domain-containing protein n=1 Tax=Ramazzottius varieornatus TaxID=947166 RepID=A0A1D1VWJ5_RAMVA|nr:hypothetical protein RvY_13482 [Ramazzottius varieornatus]